MQQLGLFWLAAQKSLFSTEKLPIKDRQGLTSGGKYSLDEVKGARCSTPKCPAAVQAWLAFLACFGLFQSALSRCGGRFSPGSSTKPLARLTPELGCAALARLGHCTSPVELEEKDEPPWSVLLCPQTPFLTQVPGILSPAPWPCSLWPRIPVPFSAPAQPCPCSDSTQEGAESPGMVQHLRKSRLTLECSCVNGGVSF